MGVGFPMKPGDVAARMNFGTIDDEGLIVDRRAGRISSEEGERLCGLLRKIRIDGVELFIVMEKGHRALVVFRGEGYRTN